MPASPLQGVPVAQAGGRRRRRSGASARPLDLRGLPEIVLMLGPERLDDDEPAFQPRRGALPGHYASRM